MDGIYYTEKEFKLLRTQIDNIFEDEKLKNFYIRKTN